MATVCHPGTGRITATFAAVAKHYGVSVAICPARRGNRKGVVEKANHTAAQRWWRTLADDTTPRAGPGRLGPVVRCCAATPDAPHRRRQGHGGHRGRRRAADRRCRRRSRPCWPSRGPPRAQALVAFRGNRYSVPPELARAQVTVSHRLGATHIELATSSGIVIARHQLAPAGAGATVRDTGHVLALERAAWPRSPPPRRTGASSASHPARPPGPPPQPCAPSPAQHRTSTVHTRHPSQRVTRGRGRPRPLRRRSPGKEHPAMTATNPTDHAAPARALARAPTPASSRHRARPRRPGSTSSCAATWPRSSCTPPPSTCPPSSTRPPPRGCR